MRRPLFSRPLVLRCLMGLLLISWGIFLRWSIWSHSEETPPSTESMRDKLFTQHQHPLLSRQHTLAQRPALTQTLHAQADISLDSPVLSSWSQLVVPPFHGQVDLTHSITTTNDSWSGSILLTGQFVMDRWSWGTGTVDSWAVTVGVSLDVHFLRSGETTRRYLDDITLDQSGTMSELLLITRAFIQEYEDVWIEQTTTPPSIRDLRTFAFFESLQRQTDHHFITTASGDTQLLVTWKERWLDATLSVENQLSALLRFPEFGIRSTLAQKSDQNTYAMSRTHYRLPASFLDGTILFIPQHKKLTSNGTWSWSIKDTLTYTGTHEFTLIPAKQFVLQPPTTVRDRASIIALWKQKKQ